MAKLSYHSQWNRASHWYCVYINLINTRIKPALDNSGHVPYANCASSLSDCRCKWLLKLHGLGMPERPDVFFLELLFCSLRVYQIKSVYYIMIKVKVYIKCEMYIKTTLQYIWQMSVDGSYWLTYFLIECMLSL